MKAVTLGAIVAAAAGGGMFAQKISTRLDTLSETVMNLTNEQRIVGRKVDRLEWAQNGRRGPAPEAP